MHIARSFLYCLLPLFAGCQLFADRHESPPVPEIRMQGQLSVKDGQLLLRPCHEQRRFIVVDNGNTGLAREADELIADGGGPLFVDLKGRLASSRQTGVDGQLNLSQLYRLEREGPACGDTDFRRLTLRASGNEPFWNIKIGGRGLLLERLGQPPLALPYMEERMPDGRLNFTSEANGQRLELWVTPQRCIDSMSGALRHLTAELRLNGEVQHGCAYAGGMSKG